MFARRRPLLRAAVVGGGAYVMGKKSANREAEESAPQAAASAEPSMSDQLTQISRLHQEGALSDEEFAAAKSRLLGG